MLFKDTVCTAVNGGGRLLFFEGVLSLRAADVAPVPGFEGDALRVVFWEGEFEAVGGGVVDEPLVGGGGGEGGGDVLVLGGVAVCEVDGVAGVVFAVAGRGADFGGGFGGASFGDLGVEEGALLGEGSVAGGGD